MLTSSMLARNLRLVIFEEDGAAELEAAVDQWLEDAEERVVVGARFESREGTAGPVYTAYLIYTE